MSRGAARWETNGCGLNEKRNGRACGGLNEQRYGRGVQMVCWGAFQSQTLFTTTAQRHEELTKLTLSDF